MKQFLCLVLTICLMTGTGSYSTADITAFPDVAADSWYAEAVYDMAADGYIRGGTDGLFHPARTVTRAEWLTVLTRIYAELGVSAKGEPWWRSTTDQSEALGIIVVGELNAYNATMAVTRIEAARWIYTSLYGRNIPAARKLGSYGFTDIAAYPHADRHMAETLQELGVFEGNNGAMSPDAELSRAEMAMLLQRLVVMKEAQADPLLSEMVLAVPCFVSGLGSGFLYPDANGQILEFPLPEGAIVSDGGETISLAVSTENGQQGSASIQLPGIANITGKALHIAMDTEKQLDSRITVWLNGFSTEDQVLFVERDIAYVWGVTGNLFPHRTTAQNPAELVATSAMRTEEADGTFDIRPYTNGKRQTKPAVASEALRYITSWEKLPTVYQPTLISINIPLCMTQNTLMRIHPLLAQVASEMVIAAKGEGLTGFNLNNAYRTPSYQQYLLDRRVKIFSQDPSILDPYAAARTRVAEPFGSEHQAGIAMDMYGGGKSEVGFETTAQSKWMAANAHRFGLIVRYPDDKQAITRTIYEPWHIRYVGLQTANWMHRQNLCFEEVRTLLVANGCVSLGKTLAVTAAPQATMTETGGMSLLGMVTDTAECYADIEMEISVRSAFSLGREVFLLDLP